MATAAIIAGAGSVLGSVLQGVANNAHGGPPSPLSQQGRPGFSYTPTAAKAGGNDDEMTLRMLLAGGGAPGGSGLRLSDIMGA